MELNQPLVEVETAKAAVEIPSPFAGVVVRLHAEAGGSVAVGAALVTFGGGGGEDSAGGSARLTPHPPTKASRGRVTAWGWAPAPPHRRLPPARLPRQRFGGLAKDLGVEIATVAGTGAAGRVTADDVQRAAVWAAPPEAVATDGGQVRAVVRCGGRSRRVIDGQAAIPQVTTFRTVDCTALEDVPARARRLAAAGGRRRAVPNDRGAPAPQRLLGGPTAILVRGRWTSGSPPTPSAA